jgi:integron integrase
MAERLVRTPAAGKPKLLDQVRDVVRRKHYSIRTEQAYIDWIKRFIVYHGKRHPGEMAEEEVAEFLTHLARDLNVAAATQNQALSALLFLYKEVLKHEIGWLEKVERAKKPPKLPVVLSRGEVKEIFAHLHGVPKLMAGLLYGSGLRLMECVRFRIKDIDFALGQITIRDAKGGKDRITMLPVNMSEPLRRHLSRVKAQHEQDLEDGFGTVHLPFALARKSPNAAREWAWQYVFPSSSFHRSAHGPKTAAPYCRRRVTKRAQTSCGRGRHCEAGQLSQFAPLFCDTFALERLRHSNGAGVTGSQGRFHYHDLHACAQPAWYRGEESAPLSSG